MNRIMSFLAGAFCGAVVGSVAALLLAPASGRDLQSQARERIDGLVEDARRAAEARRAQLEAQLNALKSPKPAQPTEEASAASGAD
ncbi:MAG TPA: YtxH domain-containing protein [Anaerolineales bacterium]|nr:YtxH domain-containing protein [Anaerolineales bacterium]